MVSMLIKVVVFQRVNANAEFLYFFHFSIAFFTMELDVFAVYRWPWRGAHAGLFNVKIGIVSSLRVQTT